MCFGAKELSLIALDTVSIVPTNLNLELVSSTVAFFFFFSSLSFSSLSFSFSIGFSSAANSSGFSSSRSLGELVSSSTPAGSLFLIFLEFH